MEIKTEKLEFHSLEEITQLINEDIGTFGSEFQNKRKELLGLGRVANSSGLFKFKEKERDWVINSGGGTELQYHLFLRNNTLGYGLGFNTQYVPFANEKSTIEYIKPYVESFLSNQDIEKVLLKAGFNYIIGDKSQLQHLTDNNYVLIGKSIEIQKLGDHFLLDRDFYNEMISNLKGIVFDCYTEILMDMNKEEMERKGLQDNIQILLYKKQIILQGPPGTGKTYAAEKMAKRLTNNDKDRFKIIQFHPSYSYEDFVRGITANVVGDKIQYITENKVLADFAEKAKNSKSKEPFVLILDEINRANLPSVLGELIYALEYRNKPIESMYGLKTENGKSNNSITIPDNLYIIGTMNTADRSVGHIDYAIIRRFAFVDVLPNDAVIENTKAKRLFNQVQSLFSKDDNGKKVNSDFLAADFNFTEVQLGHSYFMLKENGDLEPDEELQMRLEYEIKPILNEYVKDGLLSTEAQQEIDNLNVGA